MPNWCNCNISISGPTSKIKDLWEKFTQESGGENTVGLLSLMRPEPDYSVTPVRRAFPDISSDPEPSIRNDSWWDWRVINWGTKWDVGYDDGVEFTENDDGTAEIFGMFDTRGQRYVRR